MKNFRYFSILLCLTLIISNLSFATENTITTKGKIASLDSNSIKWNDNYQQIADIVKSYDLVAFKGLNSEESLKHLLSSLNDNSTIKWTYHISSIETENTENQTLYCFIYRDTVTLQKVNGYYITNTNPPYIAIYGCTFKINNYDFTYVLSQDISSNQEYKTLKEVYTYYQNQDLEENNIIISTKDNIISSQDTKEIISSEIKATGEKYSLLNTTVDNDIIESSSTQANVSLKKSINPIISIINVDLEKEIVTLKNNGKDQDMTGCKIISVTGNQEFSFPTGYIFKSGKTIKIVSGRGAKGNNDDTLKWSGSYIWNNDGDPCELYDGNGVLVDKK